MTATKTYKPPQEPTTLLTVGGVVKWQGEAFVIERFAMGEDNQTDATSKMTAPCCACRWRSWWR